MGFGGTVSGGIRIKPLGQKPPGHKETCRKETLFQAEFQQYK